MRKQIEILLGIFFTISSTLLLGWFAINEGARMERYARTQESAQIETGAILFDQNCTRCHGEKAQGTNLAPCLNCDELFLERMEVMGWGGSLEDYIIYVASNGREVSSRPDRFPGGGSPAMPIWSEQYGGPLREDQIRAIATFILNFESYALGLVAPPETLDPIESMADDPVSRGRYAFLTNECNDCHQISGISEGGDCPPLDGIATRAGERILGYSEEEYIRESILFPAAYKVEVEKDVVMPPTFVEELTESQINDLVAFLLTLDK